MNSIINIKIQIFVVVFMFSPVMSLESLDVITLGYDDFAPYEFSDDGQMTGFASEVVKEVLLSINVDIAEHKELPWARALSNLEKGRIDALFSIGQDSERSEYAYFPEESLIKTKWVVFIRANDAARIKFNTLNELVKYKGALVRGYNYTKEFWALINSNENHVLTTTDSQNLKMLAKGRVDYTICELGVGIYYAKELGIYNQLKYIEDMPIKETPQYIAFSKKTVPEVFVQEFSRALSAFKKIQSYKDIYNKWFGESQQIE